MQKSFEGLLALVISLGFTCLAYSHPVNKDSQLQQSYKIVNIKPGGGPRMPIPNDSTISTSLINLNDMQINS